MLIVQLFLQSLDFITVLGCNTDLVVLGVKQRSVGWHTFLQNLQQVVGVKEKLSVGLLNVGKELGKMSSILFSYSLGHIRHILVHFFSRFKA